MSLNLDQDIIVLTDENVKEALDKLTKRKLNTAESSTLAYQISCRLLSEYIVDYVLLSQGNINETAVDRMGAMLANCIKNFAQNLTKQTKIKLHHELQKQMKEQGK